MTRPGEASVQIASIAPDPRAVLLFAAGIPVALLPIVFDPRLWVVWVGWIGVSALALGYDAIFGLSRSQLHIDAHPPATLHVGREGELEIRLTTNQVSRRAVTLSLLLDVDERLRRMAAMLPVTLPPTTTETAAVTTTIPLLASRRGTARVIAVWLRWTGPLGLIRRTICHPLELEIAVTPDLHSVRSAALRFLDSRFALAGTKAVRFLGDGSEFEALREFLPGFDRRTMDWKATARHRKLLCREHRAERNHQVVVAIDTGRLMIEPLDGVPRLDRAIHASLVLGIVAAKTGDRVGLFAFDEAPGLFLEPAGGISAFHRVQSRTAALEYSTSETNYTLGLMELSRRLKRRSLVILITEFVDTVTAELLIENMHRLSRRHVVLFVTLRDPALSAIRTAPPHRMNDLYRSVVAGDLRREREMVQKRVQRLGIHCVDARPEAVSPDLVNRYLEIKRRELV